MPRDDLLCWMDLEMTSISDVLIDKITEVAVILTDKDLKVIAEGPNMVIHVDRAFADSRVRETFREMYLKSHLSGEIEASMITAAEAEHQVLHFLKEHCVKQTAPLCGNSIHIDRHFLRVQMPAIDDYLFYRCIDVSTIKELVRRWKPDVYEEATKRKGESVHRAKEDTMASISELRFYRDALGL